MEQNKQSAFGSWIVMILSMVLMIVAALLLFVPQIKLIYMCYFMCSVTMIAGIYMIVRYFMTDAFRNMNEYGFSVGVLIVVLGVCGIIRAEKLADSFVILLGIALACSGIVKLQYALDLKRMKDNIVSYIVLAISIFVICVAVLVILQPFEGKDWFQAEIARWYVMLIDGGLGVLLFIYMAIRLKLYNKAEKKAIELSGTGEETVEDRSAGKKEKKGKHEAGSVSKGTSKNVAAGDKPKKVDAEGNTTTEVDTEGDTTAEMVSEDGTTVEVVSEGDATAEVVTEEATTLLW